jgi:hypothetical protein
MKFSRIDKNSTALLGEQCLGLLSKWDKEMGHKKVVSYYFPTFPSNNGILWKNIPDVPGIYFLPYLDQTWK